MTNVDVLNTLERLSHVEERWNELLVRLQDSINEERHALTEEAFDSLTFEADPGA